METSTASVSLVPADEQKLTLESTARLQVRAFQDELGPASADGRRIGRQQAYAMSERGLNRIDGTGRTFAPSARASKTMQAAQNYFLASVAPMVQHFVGECLVAKPDSVAVWGLKHFAGLEKVEGKDEGKDEGKEGPAVDEGKSEVTASRKGMANDVYTDLFVNPIVKPMVSAERVGMGERFGLYNDVAGSAGLVVHGRVSNLISLCVCVCVI